MTVVSEDNPYCGQSGRIRRVFWRGECLGSGAATARGYHGGPLAFHGSPSPAARDDAWPDGSPPTLLSPIALRDLVRFLRHRKHGAGQEENIPMKKCFGVFSEITEFARPMSRRQATNRRKLLLPSLSLIASAHQTAVVFDATVPPTPAAANHGSVPRYCNHQPIHYPAAKEATQTIGVIGPELIAGSHLLPRMVFQHIRPRSRSAAMEDKVALLRDQSVRAHQ